MATILQEDNNQKQRQIQNLEQLKITEYQSRFELELNYKNSIHHKKLVIQKNGYIYEADRNQVIIEEKQGEQSSIKVDKSKIQQEKQERPIQTHLMSAFLGIQHINNQAFLFGCSTAVHICTIEKHEIFEMDQCFFIPFHDFSDNLEMKEKLNPYISNIRDLFKEGYYFSYTYDLTLSKIKQANQKSTQIEFAWNRQMHKQLWEAKVSHLWTIPLIQGYISYFNSFLEGKKVDYYLIARRSSYRAGTRFNVRGLDDNGNVANFVEQEQIVYIANYCCSSLQIRGSVPLFWQQRGITTETKITRSEGLTTPAFLKHMNYLKDNYQRIISANLMKENKPDEQIITANYEKFLLKHKLDFYRYLYFDLHHVCKGAKYEKINPEIEKISEQINNFKFYCEDLSQNKVQITQKGIFRTNCLDCLDRTNVFQTKIALETFDQMMKTFEIDLEKIFGEPPLLHQDNHNSKDNHPFMLNFKTVWGTCGDMISKHYTGTGSTHTDVTIKGKRDFFGRISHGMKSLNRFWIMNFEDNMKQEAIDMVVGEYTQTTNEFEEQLESQLNKRRSEFNTQSEVTVYITTWNIGGISCPTQDNQEYFDFKSNFQDQQTPDIVIISLQEFDNSYFGSNNPKLANKWNEYVLKNLNKFDNYVSTKQKDYIGNLLLIFNKKSVNERITDVNYDTQAVGYSVFKLSSYRGAVSIKFNIDNTSFCVTSVHLENNQSSRVSNINEIHQKGFQVEGVGKPKGQKIEKYDHKFMIGDMQYGVDLSQQQLQTQIAAYETAKRNKQNTKAADILKSILTHDEQILEKEQSIFLRNYKEQEINFLPTYKYPQHSNIYDKKSNPGWRDRILNWSKEECKCDGLLYKRDEIRYSTHRPVTALYKCVVNFHNDQKKQQIIEQIYEKLNSQVQNLEETLDESVKKQVQEYQNIETDE